MIARTINSPGIEVNEIDKSQVNGSVLDNKTAVVFGFADKGDNYIPYYIRSINEFADVYGYPTNEAERYFYNASKEVLSSNGTLIATRLPYDNDATNTVNFTKYVVDDQLVKFKSPYEIIMEKRKPAFDEEFDENEFVRLRDYYAMSAATVSDLENVYFTLSTDILDMARDYLSNTFGFDNSFAFPLDRLFGYAPFFYNLDALLRLDNFDPYPPVVDPSYLDSYLTGRDLWGVISAYVPQSLNMLSNAFELRSSYFNFANSFKRFGDIVDPDSEITFDGNFIFSGDELLVSQNELRTMKEVLNSNGVWTLEDFLRMFFKTFCLDNVKESYYNVSSIMYDDGMDFIRKTFIEESELSVDFNLDYTGVKQRVESVGSYKVIHSTERNSKNCGKMSNDAFDSIQIGESIVEKNSIYIFDKTHGRYGRNDYIELTGYETNQYLGILPVIVTPVNAMYYQDMIDQRDDFVPYNVISKIQTEFSDYAYNKMPKAMASNYAIPLESDTIENETLGSLACKYFPPFSFVNENTLDNTNFDKIGLVVFKMYVDPSNNNKVNFIPVETFIGSLDKTSKDLKTGKSTFIDLIVNESSKYINVYSNVPTDPHVDTYLISRQTATTLGFYDSDCEKKISLNNSILKSLDLIFEKLRNTETTRIDLVVDAGVSNIAQFVGIMKTTKEGDYNPEFYISGAFNNINSHSCKIWKEIIKKYDEFCRNTRNGDCMFICDGLRSFCLTGNMRIVRHSMPTNTIKKNILPLVKYMVGGINTSYGAGYCNWFRCIDDTSKDFMWMPPSIKAAGVYLKISPEWLAPAGLNRGKIDGAYDVAFNPDQSDSDVLYINNWNYALAYPRDGIFLSGQKTFQTTDSAFDRVNVRRLFNSIKRGVKNLARECLYEQLSMSIVYKFRDLVNTYLGNVQLANGCSEFYIVCDDRNNTAETMDRNELHCTIGIKPIKSLEFIVLNFVCTNQSAIVEEVVDQVL